MGGHVDQTKSIGKEQKRKWLLYIYEGDSCQKTQRAWTCKEDVWVYLTLKDTILRRLGVFSRGIR